MINEWEKQGRLRSASKVKNAMRSVAIVGVAFLMLTGISKSYAAAPQIIAACHQKWSSCTQRCARLYEGAPNFLQSCLTRCDGGLNYCLDLAEQQGKVDTPPDPIHPKGTGNHTPPIGGSKDEAKARPRVNDTRAPMGGGVFHPKSSDAGNGGPILLKSGGGNGPSFRSHGRH